MPEVAVLDTEGRTVGEMTLDDAVFAASVNVALVHQAVRVEESNRHHRTASTKTRGEVSGGGKKPWRQKGTGRARAGSSRSPIWRGGGVTFGPHPRDTRLRMPKRMRRQALRSALSSKFAGGHVVVLDELGFEEISTKRLVSVLESLQVEGRAMLLLPERDDIVLKSAQNVVALETRFGGGISTRDVVLADHLIFTRAAVEKLQKEWAA